MLQQDIIDQVDQGWRNFWKRRNIDIKEQGSLAYERRDLTNAMTKADLKPHDLIDGAVKAKKKWKELDDAQRSATNMD